MGQTYQSYQDAVESRAREGQESIRNLKQKAEDVADTVATEGAKAVKAAGETASDAAAATKRFVQEQPYIAIGAVVVAACAIGALWKLSSSRRSSGNEFLDRLSEAVEPGYRALRRRL
ncbi:hypothetical protein [uncultured Hyphomicrobium sp.]|uniref:hypothetical protein n=1 Tax=uncultured Hyphomicrobium sp. TaxID=194373 RepID=UPI0025FF647B|nr:hypothetical protein [uncultured Hyphomicrobium sp.]